MDYKVTTPIVLFYFNRKHVLEVLKQIKQYKPSKLYLVADGGRNKQEHNQCIKIRKLVDAQIDWKCDCIKFYKDENIGVDVIIPTTISKIFEREEKLIVLEDDCVPSQSFFKFCEKMLDKYQYENKIMGINGTNWFDDVFLKSSYFYSIHPESSGWATWKRAWKLYEHDMSSFDENNIKIVLKNIFDSNFIRQRYYDLLDEHYQAAIVEDWLRSYWDGKWLYSFLMNHGLSIVPPKNLITNIGFDETGTHTYNPSSYLANRKRYEIDFPVKENSDICPDKKYDKLYAKKILGFNYLNRIKSHIKYLIRKPFYKNKLKRHKKR